MKKARINRGKIRKTNLPHTKVKDWGTAKIISRIDNAIELIDRRK